MDNEHPSGNSTIRQLTMTLPISLPTLQQMTMTLPLDSADSFLESFLDVFLDTPPLSPYECRSVNEINGRSPRSSPHYHTNIITIPRTPELTRKHNLISILQIVNKQHKSIEQIIQAKLNKNKPTIQINENKK